MTEKNNVAVAPTSADELRAELERLRSENEVLKAKKHKAPGLTLKVSEKGALSIYGLGRFPVTLYPNQWEKLLAIADTIRAFVADNRDKLKFEKDETAAPAAQ